MKYARSLCLKLKNQVRATLSDFFSPLDSRLNGNYRLKEKFPYYSQWASPTLISKITTHKIPAGEDPLWQTFGWKKKKEYEFWSWRICAIACLKMLIEGFKKKKSPSFYLLTQKGQKLGGYKTHDAEGNFIDRGWYYEPLLKLLKGFGLNGQVHRVLSINDLVRQILKNHAVVASVNAKTLGIKSAKKRFRPGDHLVLVFGCKLKKGRIIGFYLHNSSGRIPELQKNAFIPISKFKRGFAYKGFSVWAS